MKKYEEIQDYYISKVLNKSADFSDFAIIDMRKAITDKEELMALKKYEEPHVRGFFEISIGVNEPYTSYFTVGNERFKNQNKHVMFVSPNQVFSLNIDTEEQNFDHSGYILSFKPSILLSNQRTYEVLNKYRFFSSYSFPQHKIEENTLNPLLELAAKIYEEYTNPKPHSREIIGAYLEVILCSFNRILKTENDTPASNSCEHITVRFERCIIEDGNRIATVADYASNLNISSVYLSECVKKVTGRSAKQIINNHKLIVAKSLLQQKEKSIADIAYEMNFSEPTNFTKFFKQLTGTTPNQFRK